MNPETIGMYCALHGEVKFSWLYNKAWDPQALNLMTGESGGG
jgi:hypothetical protein